MNADTEMQQAVRGCTAWIAALAVVAGLACVMMAYSVGVWRSSVVLDACLDAGHHPSECTCLVDYCKEVEQ